MKLGVFFGGISTEHEVSVITGLQLIQHADKNNYEVIPVYIDKKGKWWTGEKLKSIETFRDLDLQNPKGLEHFVLAPGQDKKVLDAAILCFHGDYGEGGKVQGLLELAEIPHQGPSLLPAALAMDKISFRQILATSKFQQSEFFAFSQADWDKDKKNVLAKISKLGLPVFCKPSRSGSSIGVQRVSQEKQLEQVILETLKLDNRVLVEKEVTDCIEVNVAVLGNSQQAIPSVTEQPIKSEDLLSFADKYEKGGGKKSGMASSDRRIPAPISDSLAKKLQKQAIELFHFFGMSGVVRTDFFVNPSTEDIYVIEMNTIPGSMSFYLFEKIGMSYSQLIDRLVEIAIAESKQHNELSFHFETNILKNAKI